MQKNISKLAAGTAVVLLRSVDYSVVVEIRSDTLYISLSRWSCFTDTFVY